LFFLGGSSDIEQGDGKTVELTSMRSRSASPLARSQIEQRAEKLGSEGSRILGVACRDKPERTHYCGTQKSRKRCRLHGRWH